MVISSNHSLHNPWHWYSLQFRAGGVETVSQGTFRSPLTGIELGIPSRQISSRPPSLAQRLRLDLWRRKKLFAGLPNPRSLRTDSEVWNMLTRWPLTTSLAFLLVITPLALGQRGYPTRTTQNFVVKAQTQELADQFADLAEKYRKSKAIEWLGHDMPNWPVRCDLTVTVSLSGARGATTFSYDGGQVTQTMFIEGPLDACKIASCLTKSLILCLLTISDGPSLDGRTKVDRSIRRMSRNASATTGCVGTSSTPAAA